MSDQLWRQIRERAHEIWERRGRPEGLHAEHWAEAEQSFKGEGGGTATPVGSVCPGEVWKGESAVPDSTRQNATLLDASGEPVGGTAGVRILDSSGQPMRHTRPGTQDISLRLRQIIHRQPLTAVLVGIGFGILLGRLTVSNPSPPGSSPPPLQPSFRSPPGASEHLSGQAQSD
jgi:hypothetical protein